MMRNSQERFIGKKNAKIGLWLEAVPDIPFLTQNLVAVSTLYATCLGTWIQQDYDVKMVSKALGLLGCMLITFMATQFTDALHDYNEGKLITLYMQSCLLSLIWLHIFLENIIGQLNLCLDLQSNLIGTYLFLTLMPN